MQTQRSTATGSRLEKEAERALALATDQLLSLQDSAGYWCGELEGDSILESEYILLKFIIGQEDDARLPKVANWLRSRQRPSDGAWIQYPGAGPDLSATVKGYYALKLMGDNVESPLMAAARELIIRLGGAERCNTYTRFFLAALGQIPYDSVPCIPPEIVLMPRWSYFHLTKVSAWSRTMIMPLAVLSACRPVRRLADESMGIEELYADPKSRRRALTEYDRRWWSWKNTFLVFDRGLKVWEKTNLTPLRRRSLQSIERWLLDRCDSRLTDGLGAIFPPMVYILIALRCLGYDPKGPHLTEAERQLDRLMIEEGNTIRLQPCFSPVWDTGIAAYALTEFDGRPVRAALQRACEWLLSKECRHAGDWKANVARPVDPSGWFFEFGNYFYPDVDDAAMVSMALLRSGVEDALPAARRGLSWLLAMQNDDGGWAAFDRTVSRPLLEHIPFADHNAIQDPSCPDITGRALECLGKHGFKPSDEAVQRAIGFLLKHQETEGCWFGRWGVNYIYGTWQVLCGLRAVEVDMNQPWIGRAAEWLRAVQKEDGSFGESADSYEHPELKGKGPPTASQTAWGTMGLMAVFGPGDEAVRRGIRWLLKNQEHSGTWSESWFTGTGFPRVFYLRYHLYRLYFPIMCLGRWLSLGRAAARNGAAAMSLGHP